MQDSGYGKLTEMYFTTRVDAGKQLATQMLRYKNQNCVVVALSDGAVVVGAQIAAQLECAITLLMAESINAPGEPEAVASISQEGTYSYNHSYSDGQIEEFEMEYHQMFEQAKLDKLSKMHRLLGKGDLIRKDLIRGHTVILVADGLKSSVLIDAAATFLKSIKLKKLIIATPVASVSAVDRMHLLADEISCLGTVDNYMGANHYYEDNTLPDHDLIISTIQKIVQDWELPATKARHHAEH